MSDTTNSTTHYRRRSQRVIDAAFDLIRRLNRLDPALSQRHAETIQRERLALQLYIHLLKGPNLTLNGLRLVETSIGITETWVLPAYRFTSAACRSAPPGLPGSASSCKGTETSMPCRKFPTEGTKIGRRVSPA